MGVWTVLCAVGSDAMYICHVRCNLRSAKFEFKSKSAEIWTLQWTYGQQTVGAGTSV